MRGDADRVLERAAVLQIGGDACGHPRMAADPMTSLHDCSLSKDLSPTAFHGTIPGMIETVQPLNLDYLDKAIEALADVLAQPYSPYIRDAAIQRFEYTFELAWKLLQRFIRTQTPINTTSVKDLFRESAKLELIRSSEAWFEYLKARNLTSHTYNEATADETYAIAKRFLPDVQLLRATLSGAINA